MQPRIQVADVSMRFARNEHITGLAAFANAFRGRRQTLEALSDVSFEVAAGEVLGIAGHNGAGKTTLMKLMARTLRPTTGTIDVHGRLVPLLSLGAGFAPVLTGRENVHLNASYFGMGRREVNQHMDAIIDFSELTDHMDMPLSQYSAGMRARLGFAVAAHLDAEILLLDEVLAVGDQRFQQKCRDRIRHWIEGDHTVVMVQHNRDVLTSTCDRVMVLKKGRVEAMGTPDAVLDALPPMPKKGGFGGGKGPQAGAEPGAAKTLF